MDTKLPNISHETKNARNDVKNCEYYTIHNVSELDNDIKDLIRNFPRKYLDRTNIKLINEIKINEKVVIVGTIISFGLKRFKKGKWGLGGGW